MEHHTHNFKWICKKKAKVKPHGFQNDGAGDLWCAIANTEHGKCPGKAKDGTCWFSYGGKEYHTKDFKLVKSRKYS